MRITLSVIGIELYALGLTLLQSLHHISTDEAKYLLNIPYPHPPLARTVFSFFEFIPFQELFIRFLLASLLLQAVWMVWDMGMGLSKDKRLLLSLSWLASSPLILQAGSIMMAPLTALEGLVLLWLLIRQEHHTRVHIGWIGIVWLLSLFTAYHAILYFPLVIVLLYHSEEKLFSKVSVFLLPIVLAGLYALTNPLSMVSFVNAGGENVGDPLSVWWQGLFSSLLIGGSVTLLFVGLLGIIKERRWEILLSVVLVSLFIFLSFRPYYAILFTPLFVAGVMLFFRDYRMPSSLFLILLLFGSSYVVIQNLPSVHASPAREVMAVIGNEGQGDGHILISGSFGHEWQYESRYPVRRYKEAFVDSAIAAICLSPCEGIEGKGWKKLEGVPVEVFVP